MIEKKKALLVVAGGRAIPNVLSLLWLKPQLVRIILSEQGWDHQQAFKDIALSIPGCQIELIPNVDAYNFDVGMEACQNACRLDPDKHGPIDEWEWIFDITSAPKVTGIAAYEVAKQNGISCWHVDAQRDRHVSLVKHIKMDTTKFFYLTIDDYMKAQHRTWKLATGPKASYRKIVEDWAGLARALAASPDTIELLAPLRDKKPFDVITLPASLVRSSLLQLIVDEKLLEVRGSSDSRMTCWFTSEEAAKFIGTGDWLEFYVWYEAVNSRLADSSHCQWGCSIFDGSVEKELDLVLMYKAQLTVAECKAEQNPYQAKRRHLDKLEAKANVLGGSYVCKLFITNQLRVGDNFQSFCDQAEQYKIVVITGEQLPEMAQILKKEATKPTYQRI